VWGTGRQRVSIVGLWRLAILTLNSKRRDCHPDGAPRVHPRFTTLTWDVRDVALRSYIGCARIVPSDFTDSDSSARRAAWAAQPRRLPRCVTCSAFTVTRRGQWGRRAPARAALRENVNRMPRAAVLQTDKVRELAEGLSLGLDNLLPGVQRAFHRAFAVDPGSITLATEPEDIPHWDSLGHTTLSWELEREFNIRFDVDELMELENVREIIRVVRAKLGTAA
jgi:acyl carrier protein